MRGKVTDTMRHDYPRHRDHRDQRLLVVDGVWRPTVGSCHVLCRVLLLSASRIVNNSVNLQLCSMLQPVVYDIQATEPRENAFVRARLRDSDTSSHVAFR